jgi:hypothetical protein
MIYMIQLDFRQAVRCESNVIRGELGLIDT